MKIMKRIRSQEGFTLTEMLVAMLIFSFGMLAVINMYVASFSTARSVRMFNTATRLAQDAMETMLANPLGYAQTMNDMGTVSGTGTDADPLTVSKTETKENTDYTVTVEVVEDYAINADVSVNKARVLVQWTDKGTTKEVFFESYL